MDGCKFCRMEKNGDIPKDRIDLFRMNLGKMFNYEIEVDGMIAHNALHIGPEIGHYSASGIEVPINYCPMCGRKLSE